MSLRDVEKLKSRAVKRLTTKFQREMQQRKSDFHKIRLAENINSQDMETLLLYSSLSNSSSHRQRGAKKTQVLWSMLQCGSGKVKPP